MSNRTKNLTAGTDSQNITLVHGGREYFATLENLIPQAEESIYILVYIFQDDETGKVIAKRLIEAARRGVKISILVDAFGSKELSETFIQNLKDNGIKFRKFSPFLTGDIYSIGRRLHVKAVLIDEQKVLIGGINISNHYNDNGNETWLDYAVLLEEKEICAELKKMFHNLFYRNLSKRLMEKYKLKNSNFEILINDWFLKMPLINKSFDRLIDNSREEITIMISYFMPGRSFLKLLANASKRGVKIYLINSVKWDIPFMKWAILYLYPWLQKNNIILYEWQPSILHAKVMVVDREICTIGSYNLNDLSKYNSLEMNVNIYEKNFVKQVSDELDQIRLNSSKVVKVGEFRTTWFARAVHWINYQILRIAARMMFLLKKEDKRRR